MSEEKKKRMCPRCDDKKEYDEETALCSAGHDIPLEIYLFGRQKEQDDKTAKEREKNKPKSLLGNLTKAVQK